MTALQKFIDDCKDKLKRSPDGPYEQKHYPNFECPKGSLGTLEACDSICELFLDSPNDLRLAIKIIERQRETLEKLRSGPGNNMAGWKQTWAHDFTGKCLAECEALAGGSEK